LVIAGIISILDLMARTTAAPHNPDPRTLADVLLPDGTNVNHTLVKEGWCWWYRRYGPGNTELESLEKDSREAKKGLWIDPVSSPQSETVYKENFLAQ
jgi:endonuclease YncB( thermonuclease family)